MGGSVLLPGKSHGWRSLVGCSLWGRKSRTWLSDFTFNFHFHALEKEMATHSSVLVWRIPGTGEPGGLQSMGSHRVGHDWSNLAAAAADSKESACNARGPGLIPGSRSLEKGKATLLQYSCLENPLDRGGWGLQSMASQRIRHNWVTNTFTFSVCRVIGYLFCRGTKDRTKILVRVRRGKC